MASEQVVQSLLDALISGPALLLHELPRTRGIYALMDHAGHTKYIGKAINTDFFNRINCRHTTGSEANSHKFSHTYNTGRMWRAKNDRSEKAMLVKAFRSQFIRRYCRARIVEVHGDAEAISIAERLAMFAAPRTAVEWNEKRYHPAKEPVELVDELLGSCEHHPSLRSAMEHQSQAFCDFQKARSIDQRSRFL